jgi:hypothetical protein
MIMRRSPLCFFFISFLAPDDKGGVKMTIYVLIWACIGQCRFIASLNSFL